MGPIPFSDFRRRNWQGNGVRGLCFWSLNSVSSYFHLQWSSLTLFMSFWPNNRMVTKMVSCGNVKYSFYKYCRYDAGHFLCIAGFNHFLKTGQVRQSTMSRHWQIYVRSQGLRIAVYQDNGVYCCWQHSLLSKRNNTALLSEWCLIFPRGINVGQRTLSLPSSITKVVCLYCP